MNEEDLKAAAATWLLNRGWTDLEMIESLALLLARFRAQGREAAHSNPNALPYWKDRAEAAEKERDEARAENEDHRASMFIPGEQACPECGFSLSKLTMRASDGAVGVNTVAPLEPCPNGCGPLLPVTWRQGCNQNAGFQQEQREAAEARIREVEQERDRLLFTSDKQTVAWRARAETAEAQVRELQERLDERTNEREVASDRYRKARDEVRELRAALAEVLDLIGADGTHFPEAVALLARTKPKEPVKS